MANIPDRDERIAAFIDGMMDDAQMAAFEADMAADPALADEVARLMANDGLLRDAFAAPAQQPVDAALLARMGLAEPGATVIPFAAPERTAANDNPSFLRRWQFPLSGAIAAALALTVGLSLQDKAAGGLTMEQALDGTPSGQFAALDTGEQLAPSLSFRAGDGRYCREYTMGQGNGGTTGIACRGSSGWKVEGEQGGVSGPATGGAIMAAGGAGGGSLDAVYARLQAGDPLAADQEKALINRRWAD